MRRVMEYESSIVGSYSDVHWERTRRKVMEDLPAPPSPQIVIEIGTGGVREVSGREVVEGDVGEVGDRIFFFWMFIKGDCGKKKGERCERAAYGFRRVSCNANLPSLRK